MSRPTTKGVFVGARVVEARDARDWTQARLAACLGRSAPTVSKWERGDQAPEPGLVERLADALEVPTGYFLRPIPDHGPSAIFFRSMSNAAARARARERARVRWLQHASLALQEVLDFPDVDMPMPVEVGDYRRLREPELERIAESVRVHWGLGEGPIANMLLVAENAGVVVGTDTVGSTKIDGQGTWSAVDGRPYILLAKDKNTAFRRQMDVAHELAHLILHRDVTEADLVQDFDLIEDQAKYLACALLLPPRSFPGEVFSLSLDGFLALKARWKVSVGAMIMRAHDLEMLSDQAAKLLWKYRATRGWHHREPLDLPSETPVEEPRLLRRSVEMIVNEGGRSKRDLLETDICLGAADVEMLAALPTGFFSDSPVVLAFEPRLKDGQSVGKPAEVLPFRRPA